MSKYKKLWMTGPTTAAHDMRKDEQSDPAIKLFGRVILRSTSGGSPKCQSPETGLTEMKVSGPENVRGIYDGTSTGTTSGSEFRLDMEAKSVTKASRPYTPIIALASSVAACKSSPPDDDGSSEEGNGSSSGSTRDTGAPFGKGGSGNSSTSHCNKRKNEMTLDDGSGDGCGSGQGGESVENGENGWSLGDGNLRDQWQDDNIAAHHEDRSEGEEKAEGEEGHRGDCFLDDKSADTLGNSRANGMNGKNVEKCVGQKADLEGRIGAALIIMTREEPLLGRKEEERVEPDEERLRQQEQEQELTGTEGSLKKPEKIMPCPRCDSMETKFCYFNNYNQNQPRHFCKKCQRYWTEGGTLRNVPVGSGRRKNKHSNRGQEPRLLLGGGGESSCLDKMDNGSLLSMGVGLPSGDYDMTHNKTPIPPHVRSLAPGGSLLESRGMAEMGMAASLQHQNTSTLKDDLASSFGYEDPRTGLGLATDLARVEEGSNMRLLLRDEVGNGGQSGYYGGGGGMERRGEEAALPMLHRTFPVGHPAYEAPSQPHVDMWQRNSGPWESGPQLPYPANGMYNHSGNRVYTGLGGGYGSGSWSERCESGQTQVPYGGQWPAPPPYGPAWSQAGGMWNNGGVGAPMNQWASWKPPSSAAGWGPAPQEGGGWMGGGCALPQTVEGNLKRSGEVMGASFRESGQGGPGVWAPKMLRLEEVGEEGGNGGEEWGRNSAWTRVSMGGLVQTRSVKEVTQGMQQMNAAAMARSILFQGN